jgi:hypothetical protein
MMNLKLQAKHKHLHFLKISNVNLYQIQNFLEVI